MNLADGDEILVPAYICSVVHEAIEAAGAIPRFYEINADCSLDLSEIEPRINSRTRAILAVHFFGVPTEMTHLRTLCREKGLYLIEDCAHILGDRDQGICTSIGSAGDIAIFSWRKFLAINDGASLIINNSELEIRLRLASTNLALNLRAAKGLLDQAFKSGWAPGLRRFVEFIRDQVRRDKSARENSVGNTLGTMSFDSFDIDSMDCPISDLSKYFLLRSATSQIANARRQHYRVLVDGLSQLRVFRPLAPSIPDDSSPWLLALRVEGMKDAHKEFRRRGIPASHWGDVRPPAVDAPSYPIADDLYCNLIFLPIHQDLRPEHLDKIISVAADLAETVPT